MTAADYKIREYRDADEQSWVRCRVLSFLNSCYYDDVRPRHEDLGPSSVELVAVSSLPNGNEQVIGILSIEIEGAQSNIDTVATHPDFSRRGIAASLLSRALELLAEQQIVSLDAWTREDPAANSWYQDQGFTENYRYMHVYVGDQDQVEGFHSPSNLSKPVIGFYHGRMEDEEFLREHYSRTYICRQYLRRIGS